MRADQAALASSDARRRAARDLVAGATAYLDAQGVAQGLCVTPMDGVWLIRLMQPMMPMRQIYKPSLCVVLQGKKELVHAEQRLQYGVLECLVVNVEVPAVGRVIEATAEAPYLGVVVDIDVSVLREVVERLEHRPAPPGTEDRCMFVATVETPLADCILRLIRLCDNPGGIPVLAPLLMREIYFWLLMSPSGAELYKLALPETNLERVAGAIRLLHSAFMRRISIEELAGSAGMSASSFHHHFKALTGTTPLQFQKQLRLLEARRLMLSEALTVAEAAYRTGYESASQFSRDYTRMFGEAPKRDVQIQQRLQKEYLQPEARRA